VRGRGDAGGGYGAASGCPSAVVDPARGEGLAGGHDAVEEVVRVGEEVPSVVVAGTVSDAVAKVLGDSGAVGAAAVGVGSQAVRALHDEEPDHATVVAADLVDGDHGRVRTVVTGPPPSCAFHPPAKSGRRRSRKPAYW